MPHPRASRLSTPLVAAVLSLLASPAEPQERFGGERTDVVAVEVPVQVVRDGQPVRGLSAADFSVWDGRKPQEIVGFEVVDLAALPRQAPSATPAASDAKPVPPSARRHFMMLFDLVYSEPKSIVKARAAAQKLVDRLDPSDLVAVATYSSRGPRLVLGFSSDRRQIAIAIDSLGVAETFDRAGDPLNLMLGTSGVGRGDEVFLAEALEDIEHHQASDRRFEVQRLSNYTRSLADLGKLMGNVSGRKYVVLLSEGFDSTLLVGTASEEERADMAAAVEGGEIQKVDNDARYGNTKTGNDLERMVEELRRADCVVQSVDIGGLREEGARRANGEDGLFAIAQQTGGELIRNANDLSVAMGKMLTRTSVTYVLTFQPEVARDGGYHKIKVELKNPARGARVSHRAGYYAPKPFDQRDPAARLIDAADAILSGREGGELPVSVLAAPFPGAGGKAYVPVLIEVDGASLLEGMDAGNAAGKPASAAASLTATLPTEVYAYALGPDGTIGDFFGQTLGVQLSKVEAQLKKGGLKYFGHLELAPGAWSLRVLVRNGRTGASALRVVPVLVPRLDGGAPALLSPLFPEAKSDWLIVRESPRGAQRDAPYPFVARRQAYVPASLPVLAAGREAAVSLVAFNLPAGDLGDLRIGVLVLDAEGREVPGGSFRLLEREPGENGEEVLRAGFEPASLKPGAYGLKVRLAAGAANPQAPPLPPLDAPIAAFVVR
ncbi:MAG TPA: VWA domain-containing protein [Thermoanaerobaculia bacterium]|jgi:VWFA-related protein|nr:VWA domain-containing protein [Thermoanaerobaculia bacterium]